MSDDMAVLLGAHRAEFLSVCVLSDKMTAAEAAECLRDFEADVLAEAEADERD